MIITIDTSVALSEPDRFLLQALLSTTAANQIGSTASITFTQPVAANAEPGSEVKPKRGRPRKDVAPSEPVEQATPADGEDEPVESYDVEGPTLQDAVDLATKLVADGESGKVREALAAVGAARVGKIAEGDVQAFLDALNAA